MSRISRARLWRLHYFELLVGNIAVAVSIDQLPQLRFFVRRQLDVEPGEASDELAAVDAPLKLSSVREGAEEHGE